MYMNTDIKVSVLIPCYNVDQYIDECLSSVLSQSLKDIEVICINDGSTDMTKKILYSYAKVDNRIKIIDKQNTGYGDSMNMGLELAIGEYIGIVEGDDFVDGKMFEELYYIAKKENTEIAKSCYYEYTKQKTILRSNKIAKNVVLSPMKDKSIFFHTPSIWAAIYKRNWLNQNNIRFLPTPGASYQDTSFFFKCNACCNRFIMTHKAFLYYRRDRIGSSVKSKNKVFCVCKEWNEIYRFLRKNKKRFEFVYGFVLNAQFNTYKWNFKRIEKANKIIFLLGVILEMLYRLIIRDVKIMTLARFLRSRFLKRRLEFK